MFTIQTHLHRPGRARDSIYRWSGKDATFVLALQGALLGVLQATHNDLQQQVSGVKPFSELGQKAVTLSVTVDLNGAPYFSQATTYTGLDDADEQGIMDALSAAVRPFRDSADRAKT